MIAWLLYLGTTVSVGLIVAFLVSLLRGGPGKDSFNPINAVFACIVLCIGGPFAYVEAQTRIFGTDLEDAVATCYDEGPIDGPLQYFRVTSFSGDQATVLAVGKEGDKWGSDRPVMQVFLEKGKGGWEVDAYEVLYSDRLNKDGLVFPPYR